MSYQTSKTAGDLWVSLVYITSEHEKIEGFANLSALVLAEASAKLCMMKETDDGYTDLAADIQTLEKIANVDEISTGRDMTVAAVKYSWVMTEIQRKQRELLPICLKHKLIEFSDGARFAGYGEGL